MNRILTILLACCLVCMGNAQTKPKIAIFDPTAVSVSLGGGTKDAIRELISSTVVNSKRYTVLERALLEKILQEQAFSHSSMVNDKDAVVIGKLAGAEKVLASVLSSSSSSEKLLFTVKLLNLETANVEYQQFCYANDIEDLFKKIPPTVLNLFDSEIGTYEGERKNGLPHGNGVMTYKNGDVYEGTWVNGARQGFGTIKKKNGDFYEGDWLNDQKHGDGFYCGDGFRSIIHINTLYSKLKLTTGIESYKGEWKYDKPSGKGILRYRNGCKFEGEFIKEKPVSGVLIFPNGDEYRGEFDIYNGILGVTADGHTGVMLYANGNKFDGTFYYGYFIPAGELYTCSESFGKIGIMTYANGDRYEGSFLEKERNANVGTMYYNNGDVYKGCWKNDKRNGKGVMKWSDGTIYDGEWQDDMMHGYGKMIFPKGSVKKGCWSYGIKQHKCKR